MKWISVKDKIPKIKTEVWLAYRLNGVEYYTAGAIECINITQFENNKSDMSIEWRDQNGDIIDPEYWATIQPVKEWIK